MNQRRVNRSVPRNAGVPSFRVPLEATGRASLRHATLILLFTLERQHSVVRSFHKEGRRSRTNANCVVNRKPGWARSLAIRWVRPSDFPNSKAKKRQPAWALFSASAVHKVKQYGDTLLRFRPGVGLRRQTLPDGPRYGQKVIECRSAGAAAGCAAALDQALDQPIGSKPLSALAAGKKTAAISVCDITRPAPNWLTLPPLPSASACAPGRDSGRGGVTILIATGAAPRGHWERDQGHPGRRDRG